MSCQPPWAGLRDEYLSAVLCRVGLDRAFRAAAAAGDLVTRERILPALEEAREAEEQCRLALARANDLIIPHLEDAA